MGCGLISNFGVKYLGFFEMYRLPCCGLISNFGVKY